MFIIDKSRFVFALANFFSRHSWYAKSLSKLKGECELIFKVISE